MRQLIVLLAVVILLSGLSGCQNAGSKNTDVKVVIEGEGQFPEFLAGAWKSEQNGWKFVFEPNGTMSSIVHNFGLVEMKPGQIKTVPMLQKGKSIYEPGPWTVVYTPTSRQLMVKIVLKRVYAKLGGGVIEGSFVDVINGQISKDGKVWIADWDSFPDIRAHTDKYPNFSLAVADPNYDPNEGISKTLFFEKVAQNK